MTGPRLPNPRDMRGHWVLGGNFRPGAPFTNAVAIKEKVPFAGAARGRIRFKASQAGTLRAKWLRADGVTPYEANNPADVVVVANTETKLDVDPHYGEALLELDFLPGATGTFTYVECSQV